MNADIDTLFESDFYRILDFKCRCTAGHVSKPEYGNKFSVSFVRRGNFFLNVFRRSLDSYNGCFLVSKPGYERTVNHIHAVPDECTIFEFNDKVYTEIKSRFGKIKFLSDHDWHSAVIRNQSELEFLHYCILQQIQNRPASKLEIDCLVMNVLHKILGVVDEDKPNRLIDSRIKKHHLTTIEKGKQYIYENFMYDVTLTEIADYCCVSAFHFSRIFKSVASKSPHQFLQNVRLNNAEMLLRNTEMHVTNIAFSSGFNSLEYFISAFRRKYGCAPFKFRAKSRPSANNYFIR